jgi:glycine/D-amino acid oxidase-like deaminating enzyme
VADMVGDTLRDQAFEVDLIILGGGILGAALAHLTAEAGFRVLLLRMNDRRRPRADTLRNQAWLQSGLIYKRSDFVDEEHYFRVALQTYVQGRLMLDDLGIPIPTSGGVLRVASSKKAREVETRAKRLLLRDEEFHPLEPSKAKDLLGRMHMNGSTYFAIPDRPFDEARIVDSHRAFARDAGARVIDLPGPVELQRTAEGLEITMGTFTVLSRLTVIAAGAGNVPLLAQLGEPALLELRQTPLLVAQHPTDLNMPSILIDYELGFSAVRHRLAGDPEGDVLVIGTRHHQQPVPFVLPDDRKVSQSMVDKVVSCLPDELRSLTGERYTAGMELIPTQRPPSHLEPWIHDLGDVVVASPGRATLASFAAKLVLARLLPKLDGHSPSRLEIPADCLDWKEPIGMHFGRSYSFNDAEV